MKLLLSEQFIKMQKIAGIINENQKPRLINESFEDLLQQLSAMAEKGEIGKDEIKKVADELISARRRGQSNDRKSSPDYAEKKAASVAKAAITRDQNKKNLEKSTKKFTDKLATEKEEEKERRATNKLPLTIGTYSDGLKATVKALGDLAKNYTKSRPNMEDPEGGAWLEIKPSVKDQSFDNAQIAWDWVDKK